MNTEPGVRSSAFAARHFGECRVHREEAIAVHAALEKIAQQELADLDADASLGTLLRVEEPQSADSLDDIERLMALEEEFGEGLVPEDSEVTVATWQRALMSALLGKAAHDCRWEPSTLWVRSARGVINERARWRGGCECGVDEGPSNNELQRTRPAQATEPRR